MVKTCQTPLLDHLGPFLSDLGQFGPKMEKNGLFTKSGQPTEQIKLLYFISKGSFVTSKEGPGTKNKKRVVYLAIARLGEGGGVKMLARIICEHFAQTKNSEWHYKAKKNAPANTKTTLKRNRYTPCQLIDHQENL